MKIRLHLALAGAILLAACGGSDELAAPTMRLVHLAPDSPRLTLYKDGDRQREADDLYYKEASNYYSTAPFDETWSVRTSSGGSTVGSVGINTHLGHRYSIVVLPATATDSSLYVINDPYNKPIGSSSTRLRLMNASPTAASIDLYMNLKSTDISAPGINPFIAGTAYRSAGPRSGDDSKDIPGGLFQLRITAAGSKTVLFSGPIDFDDDEDILVMTISDPTTASGLRVLAKVDGRGGVREVLPDPL
ncbi:MAG: DUF4397 domain-containing protein [Burkholderiaceae bacterium]